MKKILLSMLLCLACLGVARAEIVEIGDGGTTASQYLPGFTYFKYSLTQQIYTADEIGMAGLINSIAFKNTGAEKNRTYNVYMLQTDKEYFDFNFDWVAMSQDDMVFSGEITFTSGAWTTIVLDTPFAYNGSSNLLVGMADVTGEWAGHPDMQCLVFDLGGINFQAIYYYRDNQPIDITSLGNNGTMATIKNQIHLGITPFDEVDNFEGTTCDWELINGTCTNAWAWGTATNYGGTHALYISDNGGNTNTYTGNAASTVYATKLLHFTEGRYRFFYNWSCYGEINYDFLRVALVPAPATFTASTSTSSQGISITSLPTGWIALDGGSQLSGTAEWQDKMVFVNVDEGYYYMVFAWHNDAYGGDQPPAAVDNVMITKLTCPYEVENLALSDITTTSATLTWTAGEAELWQVALKEGNGAWVVYEDLFTTNTTTLTDLQAATYYQVKVRAGCGDDDFGSWSDILTFSTDCETFTNYPFTENFDSYTASTDVLPICWNRINTTSDPVCKAYPKIYNFNSNSNYNCLYFFSRYAQDPRSQFVVLPDMEDLAGKQITFYAYGNGGNYSTIKIGTMTNPADPGTFTVIATKTLTSYYQKYTCLVPDNETANHIAFLMEAANSNNPSRFVFVDDITIGDPTCPAPTELQAWANGAYKAFLSWSGTNESYNVMYRTAASTIGYSEPFDGSPVPTGWTQYQGLVDEVLEGTITMNAVTNGNWSASPYALGLYNMRLNIWGTSINDWLVTPEVSVENGYSLNFDLALTHYNSSNPILDPDAQADDRFVVLIYADDEWTVLREWNDSDSNYKYSYIATAGERVSINLSAYAGKNVKIAFYGESTEAGGDNDLHIDNVGIGIPVNAGPWQTVVVDAPVVTITDLTPETTYNFKVQGICGDDLSVETNIETITTQEACPVPEFRPDSHLTATTAILRWNGSFDVESFTLRYRVSEHIVGNDIIPPSEWTMVSTSNFVDTLTGLTPNTPYEAQVKSDCSDPEEWSITLTFTTLDQTVTQTIELAAGWNWFSTYLEIELSDLQTALTTVLPSATSMDIKSAAGNDHYNGNTQRWRATNTFSWDVTRMFMINVPEACEIELTGMPINPVEHPIIITPGEANWIGFPYSESVDYSDALPTDFQPVSGETIKSSDGSLRYTGTRWRATNFTDFEPNKGYIYDSKADTDRILIFQNAN